MRDWLALPLNSNTNSSDEAITTDDEDGRTYDMINKSDQKEDKPNELQGLSTWFSILNVFGVANQNIKKAASSSSRSIDHCSSRNNTVCKQDLPQDLVFVGETTDEEESDQEQDEERVLDHEEEHVSSHEGELSSHEGDVSSHEEELSSHEQDQVPHHEQEQVFHHKQEHVPNLEEALVSNQDEEYHLLVRTYSVSSIATSVETDNSTPASSEIMRSPHHKYNTTTNVKIYWNHGGKKVQVTGEFDNWSVSVDMVQDSAENRHVIEIPMDLTRDIEYKFIVDGEWRYANDLPHRTDWRGNVNNVIYKQQQHDLLQSS